MKSQPAKEFQELGGDDLDELLLELTLDEPSVARGTAKFVHRARLLNLCREAKESINPNTRRITVDLGQISLVGGEASVPIAAFYERVRPAHRADRESD